MRAMRVMQCHLPGTMVMMQTPSYHLPGLCPSVMQACVLQGYSTCSQRSQTS